MSEFKPTNKERFFLEDLQTLYDRYGEFSVKDEIGTWYWSQGLFEYAKSFLSFEFYMQNYTGYGALQIIALPKGIHLYKYEYQTGKEDVRTYKKVEPYETIMGTALRCDGTVKGFMDTDELSGEGWSVSKHGDGFRAVNFNKSNIESSIPKTCKKKEGGIFSVIKGVFK